MATNTSHVTSEDMADVIRNMSEKIYEETKEIEGFLCKNALQYESNEEMISKSNAHYADLQKQSNEHRKQWHLEVDNIFNKFESLIQSLKDHHIATINSCQSRLRRHKSSMFKTFKENEKLMVSNKVSDFKNYQSKLKVYRTIPQVPDLSLPSLQTNTVQGGELSIELGDYKATLTQTLLSRQTDEVPVKELLEEAEVIAEIPTNVKNLLNVACVESDKAWVSGQDKMITPFDIYGTVQDSVTSTCEYYPNDITVTRQGELIFSDSDNSTVNIVRDGKTETLITTPRGWHPGGLCCTKSGDILVSMVTGKKRQRKIVRYQGQRVTQEIDNEKMEDGHSKPIFQRGSFIVYVVENNNGDIVASDGNAYTVVGVDRTGKVRFRYNNKPPGGKESFGPRQIVTDSMGHIIVTDQFNDCLHILDQNGQFLRIVDNCGLERPAGLSMDSEGRLWVGLFDSGEVKVIEYMKPT